MWGGEGEWEGGGWLVGVWGGGRGGRGGREGRGAGWPGPGVVALMEVVGGWFSLSTTPTSTHLKH